MKNNQMKIIVQISEKFINERSINYIDYDGEIPVKGKACEEVLTLVYDQKINIEELKSSEIFVMFITNKLTAIYKTRLNALNFEAQLISTTRK